MLKYLPNCITVVRILLTPVFVWLYLGFDDLPHFFAAIGVLAVIMLSDVADGAIARKFSLQSRLGELLDPVADKLAQMSIVLCLLLRGIAPWWFFAGAVFKELVMLVCGAVLLKKGVEVQKARWYGKAATAVFYTVICLNLLLPDSILAIPSWVRLAGYIASLVFLYYAFVRYALVHLKLYQASKEKS